MSNYFNKYTIILIVIFILMFVFSISFPTKSYSSVNYDIVNGQNVTLKKNTTINQSFKATDNFDKIGMLLSSGQQFVKKGKIKIYIYENDKLKKKSTLKASNIVDDNYYFKYYYINFKIKKNQYYKIKMEAENLDYKLFVKTTKVGDSNNLLYINDEKNKNSLALSFLKKDKSYFSVWYVLLIFTVLFSLKSLLKNKENNYE